MLIDYLNFTPKLHETVLVCDGVKIIGDVIIGKDSSVWFNSVLRGDVAQIQIGKNTNIQDSTVIHTSRKNGPTIIGSNVTVGHMCLLHACIIEDNSFVGMSSTVMDNAKIESYGFLAAGSLLTPGKIIKSNELWAGRPAKFIRKITEDEVNLINETAIQYTELAKEYL